MVITILVGLLCGWILSLFGFNNVIINGIAQITGNTVGMEAYYLIWSLLAVIWQISSKGEK